MRITTALAAISAIALTACGDSGTVDDPSDPEQVAAAADRLAKPQPGQYQMTAELVEFSVSGASEEEQEMMNAMFQPGTQQTNSFCLTEEEADQGFTEFVTAMENVPEECEFSNFTVEDNALNATMSCDDNQGNTGDVQFEGTVSETGSDMRMTMDMTTAPDDRTVRMVMRNTTERTGECTGEAAAG